MKNSKKIILIVLSAIIIVSTFVLNAFALKPTDPDDTIVPWYDPSYMSITGVPFGDWDGFDDLSFSNASVTFGTKHPKGLAGVSYNISSYSDQNVNVIQPYFIYFDYLQESYTSSSPRNYVWCANSAFEYDGVTYGSANTRVGFLIKIVQNELTTGALYGGNIVYPSVRTVNLTDAITYDSSTYGDSLPVYSFRIKVWKEADLVTLQVLTGSYYTDVISIKLTTDASYDSLAFGVYDSVGSNTWVNFSYIRFQSFNELYEEAMRIGTTLGYQEGEANGIEQGKAIGFGEGYNEGYADGILDGTTSEIAVPDVIDSIIQAPVTIFQNIFGFELFGINIAVLIGSIFLVVVLAWIIRKLVR